MIDYAYTNIYLYFLKGVHLSPVFLVLFVGICLQGLKVIIDVIKNKKVHPDVFFSSGGFPSFHTGLASSVSMLVLLECGIDSVEFAIAFCFALLFAYDAMNVRFEAGQHAHYINAMRNDLQGVLQKQNRPLKERIGHTPLEVIGGIVLGSLLTYVLYCLFYL